MPIGGLIVQGHGEHHGQWGAGVAGEMATQ